MKKALLTIFATALLLFAGTATSQAQNGPGFPSPSILNRSVAALNDCANTFRTGNGHFWSINASVESLGACAAGPAITGLRIVVVVYAEPNCDPNTNICPAVASAQIGRVIWCANKIESVECFGL